MTDTRNVKKRKPAKSRSKTAKKSTRKKPAKKTSRKPSSNGKHPGGAPRIQFDLEEIGKLAALHCTDEEIAAFVGCSVDTIMRRRKDTPEFCEVLEKGKAQGRISLRRAMFRNAESGNATMQIWLSKNWLGYQDMPPIEDKRDHALVLSAPDGQLVRVGPDQPLPDESDG